MNRMRGLSQNFHTHIENYLIWYTGVPGKLQEVDPFEIGYSEVCAGITRKIRTLLLRRRVHYNAIWYISETFLSIEFSFVSPYYPAETKAWVGIVPASIAHGSEWENDNHDVEFKHVSETLKGMFKIIKNCLDHYLTTFLSLFLHVFAR